MSYEYYVDCANCGHQVKIDGPEDNCYFCGKNATKKEVTMAEQEGTVQERVVVPPRPKSRKAWPKYYEENKEAIIADYCSMTVRAFFKRWSLGTTTWPKLRQKWGVQGKRRIPASRPVKRPVADDIQLTEHEQLIFLQGYRQGVRESHKS